MQTTVHNSGPQVWGSFLSSLQRFELENISYVDILTSFIGFGAYSQRSLIQVGFNDADFCILSVLKKMRLVTEAPKLNLKYLQMNKSRKL